jgi:hypothetical protein
MDVAATACSKPACSSFRLAANSSLTRPLQETAVSSRALCPSLLGGQHAADHASATSTCRQHVGKRKLRFRPISQGLLCQAAGRPFGARIVDSPGPFSSPRVTELGNEWFHESDAHQVYQAATLDSYRGVTRKQVSASCPREEGACNGSKVSGPLSMEKLVSESTSLCMDCAEECRSATSAQAAVLASLAVT